MKGALFATSCVKELLRHGDKISFPLLFYASQTTEKAAQGPQSGREAPLKEVGKDPGNLCIEEICRCPQRSRPLCRGHGHKRYEQDCVASGSLGGRTSGMRRRKVPDATMA
jgi:hypothetical protein